MRLQTFAGIAVTCILVHFAGTHSTDNYSVEHLLYADRRLQLCSASAGGVVAFVL